MSGVDAMSSKPVVNFFKEQRETRAQIRKWQTEKVQGRLEHFRSISDLHTVHRISVVKARPLEKTPSTTGPLLANIFGSGSTQAIFDTSLLQRLPPVTLQEPRSAMRVANARIRLEFV